MNVLPDTSIWIETLRRTRNNGASRLHMEELLRQKAVLMCGPVLAEILAGTAKERREQVWLSLGSLPWAELDHEAWRQVGELANNLSQRGRKVALTDLTIGVAAARAGAAIWTRDPDFERVQEGLPELELYQP